MMETFKEAPGQIMFQGHNLTRAIAIEAARKHLVDVKHVPEFDADTMLVDTPNRVSQAWFNDEAGIVQREYPDAEPVTVVNIPMDEGRAPAPQKMRYYRPTEIR
jgi:hypothetical protein